MSRKRKYKVWDIANNEMIKGNFHVVGENGFVFIADETNSRDYTILLDYIDVLDKNDTEICEGDIVECWSADDPHHIGIIEYTSPCFSLKIPGKLIYNGGAVKQWDKDIYLDMWCNAENIQIIGNIYENPNLLPDAIKK